MAKKEKSFASGYLVRSGSISKKTAQSSAAAKTVAGSALSQRPDKASAGSERVIRQVSNEHRDALKRLVDR